VEFSNGFGKLMTPGDWFFCCLVLWVVFFPIYITTRSKHR